ncbi:MAG TPA: TonB family protein, partial [Longimicrobium sp.]|nr:TonB family protein [Longimicrobium sp.]
MKITIGRLGAVLLLSSMLPLAPLGAQDTARDAIAQDTLRAVEVGAVDVRPAFVDAAEVARLVGSEYPRALNEGGVGGEAVVRFLVDVLGRPQVPRLLHSSGNAELDSAAMRVAAGVRLTPARWFGGPYPVWVELPVKFVSPNAPADTAKAPPREFAKGGIEELPELRNRSEVSRSIGRLYPKEMLSRRIGGSVTVRFRVSPEGVPEAARIERASRPDFVEPAAHVVRAMRFRPARV